MFKRGDHVVVVQARDGVTGPLYVVGASGTIVGFRTNRFYGRQAIVLIDGSDPDDPSHVDWTLTNIAVVTEPTDSEPLHQR